MGRGRTLAEFQREFPDEARCDAFLSARRWRDGFVCPACGGGRAVALKSRPRLLECLDCGRQTSLTAGHGDASIEIAADDVVLGGASNGDAFQRHVGATIGGPTGQHVQDGLAAGAEASALDGRSRPRSSRRRRRGGSDGDSLPRRRRVLRARLRRKILVVGAVEVIDRGGGRPKPSARAQSISTPVRVGCAWP